MLPGPPQVILPGRPTAAQEADAYRADLCSSLSREPQGPRLSTGPSMRGDGEAGLLVPSEGHMAEFSFSTAQLPPTSGTCHGLRASAGTCFLRRGSCELPGQIQFQSPSRNPVFRASARRVGLPAKSNPI